MPVIVQAPTLSRPAGGETTSNNTPTLTVTNGRVQGRTGTVDYRFFVCARPVVQSDCCRDCHPAECAATRRRSRRRRFPSTHTCSGGSSPPTASSRTFLESRTSERRHRPAVVAEVVAGAAVVVHYPDSAWESAAASGSSRRSVVARAEHGARREWACAAVSSPGEELVSGYRRQLGIRRCRRRLSPRDR